MDSSWGINVFPKASCLGGREQSLLSMLQLIVTLRSLVEKRRLRLLF
ncbi:hypothetical protein [Pseudobacteriovorax antillogorgiicola]|nr:hypothetical protein [Pseudobacteriovorax antillogorgiicola]